MSTVNLNTFGSYNQPAGVSSETNVSLNASGIVHAMIAMVGTTKTITKVQLRYTSRTGTPPEQKVGIETVGSDGYPTGTYYGGASPCRVLFTPPSDASWNNLTQELTLANPWTPTKPSDVFALTVRYSSGTINTSNFSSWLQSAAGLNGGNRGMPYVATYNGSAWSKLNANPTYALVASDGTVYGQAYQQTYNTATADIPGYRSAKFFCRPGEIGSTFTVIGCRLNGRLGTASTGSCYLKIWNTSGTVLASSLIDTDWQGLNTGAATSSTLYFDAPAILSYGVKYYVGLEVISGPVYLTGMALSSSAAMSVFPDGLTSGLATYDGTSWTETASVYPLCDLIVSDITVPRLPMVNGGFVR